MLLSASPAERLAQRLEKPHAALIVREARLPPFATVHDVVDCPEILPPQSARHAPNGFGQRRPRQFLIIQWPGLTPFQELVLNVKDIARREKREISLMPEGLVNSLTVGDFASLLDYLESLAKK